MIPYCWPQRKPQPRPPAPEPADRIEGHLLRIISLLEKLVVPQPTPVKKLVTKTVTPGYMHELKAKLHQRNHTPSSSR